MSEKQGIVINLLFRQVDYAPQSEQRIRLRHRISRSDSHCGHDFITKTTRQVRVFHDVCFSEKKKTFLKSSNPKVVASILK